MEARDEGETASSGFLATIDPHRPDRVEATEETDARGDTMSSGDAPEDEPEWRRKQKEYEIRKSRQGSARHTCVSASCTCASASEICESPHKKGGSFASDVWPVGVWSSAAQASTGSTTTSPAAAKTRRAASGRADCAQLLLQTLAKRSAANLEVDGARRNTAAAGARWRLSRSRTTQ